MKVLVTGGAGFIGSHVVDMLISKGFDVAVADNLSNGKAENVNKKARFYKADITTHELVDVFQSEIPDCVIHLAAHINLRKSLEDPAFDATQNIMGSLNVLENCRHFHVKKIIYSSTAAVYGEPRYMPVDEVHLIRPTSPYGLSKAVVEDYIRLYSKLYSLKYAIVRYANVYGPRQDPLGEAGVVSIFIDKMLKGENPEIYGDGCQTRDFIFVKDVASATIAAMDAENGIYNVGTEKETSVNELFNMLAEITGFKGKPQRKGPKNEVRRICLRCSKKEMLGWEPKANLHEGLEKTADYFRDKMN
jgi:UDP-glucose 4-epimerase